MRDRTVTVLLSFGLVFSLLPSMSFPATMPALVADLRLTASEAGWGGGIYFAGYALAVPFLSSWTDRIGARTIYLASCLFAAVSCLAVAFAADGFWSVFVLRFIGGAALAGVHMPGLKLLTDMIGDGFRMRGAGYYASSYALGSAGSFFFAGSIELVGGWPLVFGLSATGPVLATICVTALPKPPSPPSPAPVIRFALLPLLRNRNLMTYVAGYAGNTWEVFSIRVWFVAYAAWVVGRPGETVDLPPLAVVSGVAAIIGVPASVLVSELGLRVGREKAVIAACGVSVAVCLGLAVSTGMASVLILPLLFLLQITSFADVGSLTAGAIAASEPGRRGASLALFAFTGSMTGFLGPVVVGVSLDLFGGVDRGTGWTVAFLVMALGSTAAALAVRCARGRPAGR